MRKEKDMRKKENIKPKDEDPALLSEERLNFESEQAMFRMHYSAPDIDVEWERFNKDIEANNSLENVPFTPKRSSRIHYIVASILISAAAVLLLLLAFNWYSNSLQNKPITVFLAKQGIQTITMHVDNKVLPITAKGVSDPVKGVSIDSRKADFSGVQGTNLEMRTITTPYGKSYQITLNDGTEVTMNAGSKLIFPTQFTGSQRNVKLEGEAYFKIAKNKKMPFVVETDKMNTRAVGTEFDVKAYKGSEPHVTLVKGIVIVSVPTIDKSIRLTPGEEISFISNTVNVKNIDVQSAQWKDGYTYYDNTPLIEVLHDLGRWYNVSIEINDPSLTSYRLHFIINRNSGIGEAVDNLNDFGYLHVTKSGDKMIISKKKDISRD